MWLTSYGGLPAQLPISVSEFVAFAGFQGQQDEEALTARLRASTFWAEEYTRRAFVEREITARSDAQQVFEAGIYLPKPPIASIIYVKSAGLDMSTSSYGIGAYQGCILFNVVPVAPLEIRYAAGYSADGSAVPAAIKEAIMMHSYNTMTHIKKGAGDKDAVIEKQAVLELLAPFRVVDALAHV
jgi:hypothetical protein